MTPSAKRLLGLIKHRAHSESVYWVRLNLSEIGASLQLTRRTMMRAKAELIEMGLIRFRTISNGTGRGHKIHAALPERLRGKRGELLHSNGGRYRNSWTKIGGRQIERVTRRPRDTTYTKGTLRVHHITPPPAPRGDFSQKPSQDFKSCAPPAGECSIRTLNRQSKLPSKRLIRFAHWLKRDLWRQFWWENCKIQRSDAHLFGYALRSLLAGHDLDAIRHCFERALKEMHGTATDVGLMTGDSHTVFSLSSTVSKATEHLQTYQRRAEGKEPDGIVKRSVGSRDSVNKKLPAAGFEPATSKEPVVRIEPATNHCQRARFASIMDALA